MLLLVSLFPLSAFASNEASSVSLDTFLSNTTSSDIRNQVKNESAYLENLGLLKEDVGTIVNVRITASDPAYSGAAATIEYTIDYDLFKETLTFTELSDTNASFISCSEDGSAQNSLELYADGSIVENDKLINISFTDNVPVVSPLRDSDRWFQSTCPYGSSADYTVHVGTTRISNIPLSVSLAKETFSNVYSIIINAIIHNDDASDALANVFTNIVFESLKASCPQSQGLSCIDGKFWHKSCSSSSGGYISAYRAYVTSHAINWYPQINMKGTPIYTRDYEIHKIY